MRRSAHFARSLACGFAVALIASFCLADPPEPERLVQQLGSDQFSERAIATRALQEMGRAAIPHLVDGVRTGDVEVRRRALVLLGDLAASNETENVDAVFAALSKLAEEDYSAASFAEEALESVRGERSEAALAELQRFGATATWQNAATRQGLSVSLGAKWRGGDSRVELLMRLTGLKRFR